MKEMNNQAILFLSDKSTEWIVNNYTSIRKSVPENSEAFFLYHQKNNNLPEVIKNEKHFVFTNDIMTALNYQPIENSLVPGSNHFPLLKFYLKNPHYDYYWNIEDDVCFQGNWEYLFNSFKDCDADFISSHIATYHEEPNWYWWFSLTSGNDPLPFEKRIKSFNPIYRISNRALALLHQSLLDGWRGHHEVVIPTLLFHMNYKIIDIGGTGSFVPEGFENKFYTYESLSHLPIEMGDVENRIYHPIKEKKKINFEALKKYCVISAVGKNSLHREWIKESPDFDLHLIIYDNSYNKFYNDTDFISYQKGYKFKLVYDYLVNNPIYLDAYEYFFIPDDDILMDAANIEAMFDLMLVNKLQIAQPALFNSYYTYEHTLKSKFTKLRYTNFVEMMVPCFSRDALKKVMFTFNENNSGWGIEFHWPQLIGFTGNEMAVIDDLYVVHTRPIQSSNQQNYIELNDYIQKFNLSLEIKEHGFIPAKLFFQADWEAIITDRETHSLLLNQLDQIAHILLQSIQSIPNQGGLLDGTSGISLFFLHYYKLTGKRKYLDQALSILEWTGERISLFKDDFSFSTGLPGLTWYIEYLSQHGYIENDTDEIMEDVCEHLNNANFINDTHVNFSEVFIGYGQHYLSRIANSNFNIHKELNRKEKEILEQIITILEQNYKESFESKINVKTNYLLISNCLLFLCKANQSLPYNDKIKTLVGKFSTILKKSRPTKKFSTMQKAYTLYTASKVLENKSLRIYSLRIARNSVKITEITSYQAIYDIHLLNRLYQETRDETFRTIISCSLESFIHTDINLDEFIRNNDNIINLGVATGLCGLGLILISAMADFKEDWDSCILL